MNGQPLGPRSEISYSCSALRAFSLSSLLIKKTTELIGKHKLGSDIQFLICLRCLRLASGVSDVWVLFRKLWFHTEYKTKLLNLTIKWFKPRFCEISPVMDVVTLHQIFLPPIPFLAHYSVQHLSSSWKHVFLPIKFNLDIWPALIPLCFS